MNPSDGTLDDVVFFFEPGEEGREDAPDVVDSDAAGLTLALEYGEIGTDVFGGVFRHALGHSLVELLDGVAIIADGGAAAAFDLFGRKEGMQKAFVGFVGGLLGFIVSSDIILADDTQQYAIQQCHLFDIQSLSHGVADFYDQFFFHGFFVFRLLNIL